MKINRIHAVLGSLLVVVPILGFGHTVKNGFSIFAGTVILFFAIQSIHHEYKKRHRRPHKHDTFVEGRPSRDTVNATVAPTDRQSSDHAPTEDVE